MTTVDSSNAFTIDGETGSENNAKRKHYHKTSCSRCNGKKRNAPPESRFKLYKADLCSFFQVGLCNRGDKCTFAHTKNELRDRPNLLKTRICKDHSQSGFCKLKDECPFAHGLNELRLIERAIEMSEEQGPCNGITATQGKETASNKANMTKANLVINDYSKKTGNKNKAFSSALQHESATFEFDTATDRKQNDTFNKNANSSEDCITEMHLGCESCLKQRWNSALCVQEEEQSLCCNTKCYSDGECADGEIEGADNMLYYSGATQVIDFEGTPQLSPCNCSRKFTDGANGVPQLSGGDISFELLLGNRDIKDDNMNVNNQNKLKNNTNNNDCSTQIDGSVLLNDATQVACTSATNVLSNSETSVTSRADRDINLVSRGGKYLAESMCDEWKRSWANDVCVGNDKYYECSHPAPSTLRGYNTNERKSLPSTLTHHKPNSEASPHWLSEKRNCTQRGCSIVSTLRGASRLADKFIFESNCFYSACGKPKNGNNHAYSGWQCNSNSETLDTQTAALSDFAKTNNNESLNLQHEFQIGQCYPLSMHSKCGILRSTSAHEPVKMQTPNILITCNAAEPCKTSDYSNSNDSKTQLVQANAMCCNQKHRATMHNFFLHATQHLWSTYHAQLFAIHKAFNSPLAETSFLYMSMPLCYDD